MARNDKYHPDYKKLYPGIERRPDILSVLKKSDRKMEYIEIDIKTEHYIQRQNNNTILQPSREDSYDRMVEDEVMQFSSDEASPEEAIIHFEEIHALHNALLKLAPDEKALIYALYFDGLSERGLSEKTGASCMTIHDRKVKILNKLHKLLEN